MKSLFVSAILFCTVASAKAQLPPVRTSDPAGTQTERVAATATTVPVRSSDNVSANTSNTTLRTTGSTSSQVPVRSSDSRTINAADQKIPVRSSDPASKSADSKTQVPLKTTESSAADVQSSAASTTKSGS